MHVLWPSSRQAAGVKKTPTKPTWTAILMAASVRHGGGTWQRMGERGGRSRTSTDSGWQDGDLCFVHSHAAGTRSNTRWRRHPPALHPWAGVYAGSPRAPSAVPPAPYDPYPARGCHRRHLARPCQTAIRPPCSSLPFLSSDNTSGEHHK